GAGGRRPRRGGAGPGGGLRPPPAARSRPASRRADRSRACQGGVEIVVYNRAILLFMSDSEAVRRIRMEWAGPTGASVPAARAAPATLRDGSQRRAGRDFWLRWATVRAPSILRSCRLRPAAGRLWRRVGTSRQGRARVGP